MLKINTKVWQLFELDSGGLYYQRSPKPYFKVKKHFGN